MKENEANERDEREDIPDLRSEISEERKERAEEAANLRPEISEISNGGSGKANCEMADGKQPTGSTAEAASEAAETGRRRNGNVARLPKAVRDQINRMIEDGVPYAEIIESLGEHGKELDKSNLTRWKDGGYKDWLAEQAFIARTRARQETPSDLVRDFDGTEVNHAALQLGTLHIFEALRDLGPGSLNEKLGGDCGAFARLINALARASRETMLVQKYREACTRARAVLNELKDPKRKLTQSETRAIVQQVDSILGLDSEVDIDWSQFRGGSEAPNCEGDGTTRINTKGHAETPKSKGDGPQMDTDGHGLEPKPEAAL